MAEGREKLAALMEWIRPAGIILVFFFLGLLPNSVLEFASINFWLFFSDTDLCSFNENDSPIKLFRMIRVSNKLRITCGSI